MKTKLTIIGMVLFLGIFMVSCNKDDNTDSTKETTTKSEETTAKEEEETIDVSQLTIDNDSDNENVQAVLKSMLGDNPDPENIIEDLNFDKLVGDLLVSYKVVENDVMSKKGKLEDEISESQDVYIMVNYKTGKCNFKFKVLSDEEVVPVRVKYIADNMLHNLDNIRGNISLPESIDYEDGIDVKWTCNSDLITISNTGENGEIPAGVVTRGANDQKVVLKGVFTYGEFTYTKEYELTIKQKPEEKDYSAYVYTYFRGNIYGNGESQHIHMAVSEDGFYWNALNDNEPILKAQLGTKGVRDSYLVRSPEGDHFYLIGTDLDANGGNWADYGGNGSRYIRVWESDDLVNWSEERLILIAPENAACMWAPETTYDETTGEYVVYWATGLKGGNGKKIWYAKTRDFYTFTEPQIYKDVENGTTFIDTTITQYNGTIYRFTKNENELSILLEISDTILGDFSLVKTRIAGETGVEGPAIYKINGEEKWVLYMDGYTGVNSGIGYFPLLADSLEALKKGDFIRMSQDEYEMPEGAKHGSFVPVTQEEYDALVEKWGIN